MKLYKTEAYLTKSGQTKQSEMYVIECSERLDFSIKVAELVLEIVNNRYMGMNAQDHASIKHLREMTVGMWKDRSIGLDITKAQLTPINKLIAKVYPGKSFFTLFFPKINPKKLSQIGPSQMKQEMDRRRAQIKKTNMLVEIKVGWLEF